MGGEGSGVIVDFYFARSSSQTSWLFLICMESAVEYSII